MPPTEVFEIIGTRGVIVSPASATGGPLELAIDKLYGMFEVEDAEDDSGDINSMLSEYVASRVQPEAVLTEEDEEFGHMPPKTYNEASVEDRVGENDRPAERKFAPSDGAVEDMDKCDQAPLFLFSATVKRDSSDPPAPLLQSPENTVTSPPSSRSGIKAFGVEVDKKGRLENIVLKEGFEV
jgi:hypothetical protein